MADIIFNPSATFSGTELGMPINRDLAANLEANSPVKAFFNKADLLKILEPKDCLGIRFYPALTVDGTHTVTAVGVRRRRQEINDTGYIRSEGINPSTVLTLDEFEEDRKRLVDNLPFRRTVEEAGEVIFAVYFSREELTQKLLLEDAIGIRLYLDILEVDFGGETEAVDTYTAVRVSTDMKNLSELPTDSPEGTAMFIQEDPLGFVKSAAPCPPDCGGQDVYGRGHEWGKSNP